MEIRKCIEILRATIDPNRRQEAENQLEQIHKIIGFAPSLLRVIMMADCELPVRQAGAIYLKNLIISNWQEKEVEPGQPVPFALHEQDRGLIRDSIVEAVVLAPELIQTQLCSCVSHIIKHDFPGKWTQVVDKISVYLLNPDPSGWYGALLCLFQLVKHFEYKKEEDRQPLYDAMNLLLPQLYQLEVRLLPDQSDQSVLLQKTGLKVYFAFTQFILPLTMITKEVFTQWMEICRVVVERPVPPEALQPEEDERPELPWWKCKKWALHIITRMFERYGSPGNVSKEYQQFAEWYLPTFSVGILEVLLRILDNYRNNQWIAPRVLQQSLNYLTQAVGHALTWKILKPHMVAIIRDVIFPLMSYSKEDAEMWEKDPQEYIRVKFDVFEDFVSPVVAAQSLLHSACKKRKDMLAKTMFMITQILNNPAANQSQKDGALHVVGTLGDILLKKAPYKQQLDELFTKCVFPEFNSPHGHMRGRAVWVLHYLSDYKFPDNLLAQCIELTIRSLLTDTDLPVKVEAAVALEAFLSNQEKSKAYIAPQIREIALELLKLLRETESDEVTNVMQKCVCLFADQLAPVSVEICQNLASTFVIMFSNVADENDDRSIPALGILTAIETVLTVMDEQTEIMAMLETAILPVIAHVMQNYVIDYYEEVLSIIHDLTLKRISNDMWKVFELIYQVFMKDGNGCFSEYMPVLHNYITVDTEAFLSDEKRLLAIFNISKDIFNRGTLELPVEAKSGVSSLDHFLADMGEEPQTYGAKLLEIVLLQCRGKINNAAPMFVELAATRLLKEIKTTDLRLMCLQVLIAALYYDPNLLFSVLQKIPDFTNHFVKQWLHDADRFLGIHDRKLCIIGLCNLIALNEKPPALIEMAPKIVPALIYLFENIKKAYAFKAQAESDEDSDTDIDDDVVEEFLSSDEDEIDDENQDYLESIGRKVTNAGQVKGLSVAAVINEIDGETQSDNDDDDDPDFDLQEETILESYDTQFDSEDVDEYLIFKKVMTNIKSQNLDWYNALTNQLTEEQLKILQEVAVLAEQRAASRESKRIDKQGGYVFTQKTVPTSFKFGDSNS